MENNDNSILVSIINKINDVFSKTLEKELKNLPLEQQFKDAFKEVNELIPFVIEAIEQLSPEELRGAGLSGNQLALKKEGFDRAEKKWEGFYTAEKTLSTIRKRITSQKSTQMTDALLSLLKWVNTILGSLSSIIPICEPIKEFKECIENHLTETMQKETNGEVE